MTDLLNMDFKIERHLAFNDTIKLRTGNHEYEMNPAQILGVVNQLTKLTTELMDELIADYIKK